MRGSTVAATVSTTTSTNTLFLPVVRGYEFVLPNYVQGRLTNAFDNVGEFGNLANSLLQFKLQSAGTGRFIAPYAGVSSMVL